MGDREAEEVSMVGDDVGAGVGGYVSYSQHVTVVR